MSFSSMHDDYLDPDRHLWQAEDYGLEPVKDALRKRCTRRWRWDAIDCCLTGKYADLEPWGQQGVQLVGLDEDNARFVVHCGATIPGLDACINMPKWAESSDDVQEKVRDVFMSAAQEHVIESGLRGEWDGDSWYMHYSHDLSVPTVVDATSNDTDHEAVAVAIIKAAENHIEKHWEPSLMMLGDQIEILCGWKSRSGRRLKDGRPGKESAWAMYRASLAKEGCT